MNRTKEIKSIRTLYDKTLKLISLYKKNDVSVPFTLKGNLGEFLVRIELFERFPQKDIQYHGGAFPGVDIVLDNAKIQIKTQIKHSPTKFKNGFFDFESSPTIKKVILDEGKCNILILVILYPNDKFNKITRKNIYVFDKHDFRYFNTKLCWSGKSKGDYTIVNVLAVEGTPPKKLNDNIAHYNTKNYRSLFSNSKDNWGKIEKVLKSPKL